MFLVLFLSAQSGGRHESSGKDTVPGVGTRPAATATAISDRWPDTPVIDYGTTTSGTPIKLEPLSTYSRICSWSDCALGPGSGVTPPGGITANIPPASVLPLSFGKGDNSGSGSNGGTGRPLGLEDKSAFAPLGVSTPTSDLRFDGRSPAADFLSGRPLATTSSQSSYMVGVGAQNGGVGRPNDCRRTAAPSARDFINNDPQRRSLVPSGEI